MKRRTWFFLIAVLSVLAGCTNGSWSSGDRVLVSKFLYESGIEDPHRYDVVVFKYPGKPSGHFGPDARPLVEGGPIEKNVPKNYIKRLLGLPGEILAIFFGRIYRLPAPPAGAPPYFEDINDANIAAVDLWKHPRSDDAQARKWFEAGRAERKQGDAAFFEITRKPPEVMLAMRRIVHDNDFPAKDLSEDVWKRWKPAKTASAWTEDKSNGFAHSGQTNAESKDDIDWLRYRHIVVRRKNGERLVPAKAQRRLITDFLDYNSSPRQLEGGGHNWVGDLMLECKVDVARPEGALIFQLSKGINRFEAIFDLGNGQCKLIQKTYKDGKLIAEKMLAEHDSRLKAPGSYLVRFANIDARLTVWVDRELPFGDGKDYPPPEVRGKDELISDRDLGERRGPTSNDLEPASIGSRGAAVQIHNLRLWRDTYYTLSTSSASDQFLTDEGASTNWSPTEDSMATWKNLKRLDFRTMYAQPGHYICLGDNSPASSDSRDWGLVPDRLMLGRALLVYFPFQRAGPIR